MHKILSLISVYCLFFNSITIAGELNCTQILQEIQKVEVDNSSELESIMKLLELAEDGFKEYGLPYDSITAAAAQLLEDKTVALFKSKLFIKEYATQLEAEKVLTRSELNDHFVKIGTYDKEKIISSAKRILKTIDKNLNYSFGNVEDEIRLIDTSRRYGVSKEKFAKLIQEWKQIKDSKELESSLHIILLAVATPTKEIKSQLFRHYRRAVYNNILNNIGLVGALALIGTLLYFLIGMNKEHMENERKKYFDLTLKKFKGSIITADKESINKVLIDSNNYLKEYSNSNELWSKIEDIKSQKDQLSSKLDNQIIMFLHRPGNDTFKIEAGTVKSVKKDGKKYEIELFENKTGNEMTIFNIDEIDTLYFIDKTKNDIGKVKTQIDKIKE